jgi:putative solute:sodium symporter small subunit
MQAASAIEQISPRALILKASLLAVWAGVSFGCCYFARDLDFMVAGWPFNYWMAAQGAVLVFIAILAFYAWAMNRMDDAQQAAGVPPDA